MDVLIRRATGDDCQMIVDIGRIAVEVSHRSSCSVADMEYFLTTHYNNDAILAELNDPAYIYHVVFYDGRPAGFSKIILNASHPNIASGNVTKLDRIYILADFYDKKLGFQLLSHNVALAKEHAQCGMWLFTWTGNERAVSFYKRNGFTVIGDHKFKVSDTHYNPHYQMYLDIN